LLRNNSGRSKLLYCPNIHSQELYLKLSQKKSLYIECKVPKTEDQIIQDARKVLAGAKLVKTISIIGCGNISGRFIREFSLTDVTELVIRGLSTETNFALKMLIWLPKLTRIEIANCGVFHLTQQVFARNRNLTHLYVSDNQRVSIAENTLSHLEGLQLLEISNNQLDSLEFLRKTHNLDTLDLNTNKIEMLASDLFNKMKKLRKLHMGQNKLSELPHGLLDHMTHLESLIINCNNLKTFPIGLLRNNKFVTEFELDNDSERCLKSRKTSVPNDMFLSRYIQNITFRNVAINRLPERWLSNCSGNTLLNIKSNTFKN